MTTRHLGTVTGGRLNLRAAADTSAVVQVQIPDGTLLEVAEYNDTWFATCYGDKAGYVKRIVEELHDYLKANLQIDDYNAMIKAIIEEGSDEYKIACLVSLSKYEETRKKVYIMLKNYPLLRSRISQLSEDVFKKKKELLTELNRYGQRLIWHIQRLYRVRNSIIHSGEPEKSMVYLVEHLHSYVDEVLLDIIDRMTRSCSLGTIANVLLDAQLFMDTIEKEYTKDEEFQPCDIKMIMD